MKDPHTYITFAITILTFGFLTWIFTRTAVSNSNNVKLKVIYPVLSTICTLIIGLTFWYNQAEFTQADIVIHKQMIEDFKKELDIKKVSSSSKNNRNVYKVTVGKDKYIVRLNEDDKKIRSIIQRNEDLELIK